MLIVRRSQIQQQTLSNLISAGILRQEEADSYNAVLSDMPYEKLLTTLLESHQMRDDSPNPTNHYQIGEISLN